MITCFMNFTRIYIFHDSNTKHYSTKIKQKTEFTKLLPVTFTSNACSDKYGSYLYKVTFLHIVRVYLVCYYESGSIHRLDSLNNTLKRLMKLIYIWHGFKVLIVRKHKQFLPIVFWGGRVVSKLRIRHIP